MTTVSAAPLVAAPDGPLTLGTRLATDNGVWLGVTTHYGYQWQRSGVPIAGAGRSDYVLTAADHGAMLACLVSAYTAGGSATQVSNTVGPAITSGPPAVLAAPEITPSLGLTIGTVLTTTAGSWSGEPSGYAYQWLANNQPISGAVTNSHTIVAADANTTLSCAVVATNAAGSTMATSAGVGPVSNSNPLNWHNQVMTWHGQQMTWN